MFDFKRTQKRYYKQMKNGYQLKTVHDVYGHLLRKIVTPYVNFLGDNFVIYVIVNEKWGIITVSDDGETLNNLSSLGIQPMAAKYKPIVMHILRHHNLKLKYDDTLCERCLMDNFSGLSDQFASMESNMIQAMLQIDVIYLMQKKDDADDGSK